MCMSKGILKGLIYLFIFYEKANLLDSDKGGKEGGEGNENDILYEDT